MANCQEIETVISKKEDFQDWKLRVGPYLWFLGIEGMLENPPVSIQPPGEHYDFDKSISDLNNSLKFAMS